MTLGLGQRKAILVGTLLAGACGDLPAFPQEYLDRPFFQYTSTNGTCQRVVAVDAQRQGWMQTACNGTSAGYQQTRVLTEAEFTQVQTAFDALPPQPDPACDDDFLASGFVTYLRRGTADADVTWTACVSGAELAEPYLTPVEFLKQFAELP